MAALRALACNAQASPGISVSGSAKLQAKARKATSAQKQPRLVHVLVVLRPDPSVDVMMAESPIRVVVDEKERPKLSVPLVKDELPMVVELEFQERPELSLPLVKDELPIRCVFWLQLEPVLALDRGPRRRR